MDLTPFVRNSVSLLVDEEGYTHLRRFTAEQQALLGTHALYRGMLTTSSGCSLTFRTRASSIAFRVKRFNNSLLRKEGDIGFDFAALYGRKMVLHDSFSLLVQGTEQANLSLQSGELSAQWENPERREQIVELFFPLSHQLAIQDLRCNEPIEAIEQPQASILVMGDSLVQGVGVEKPYRALTPMLASLTGKQVINQGMMGALFNADIVSELPRELGINTIVVAYGTNDWVLRESLEELEEAVRALLQRLSAQYPRTKILLLAPIWRADFDQDRTMGSFSQMYEVLEEVADAFPSVIFVDCLSCVAHDSKYFSDGFLHLNAEGYVQYVRSLEPYLT